MKQKKIYQVIYLISHRYYLKNKEVGTVFAIFSSDVVQMYTKLMYSSFWQLHQYAQYIKMNFVMPKCFD